MAEIVKALFLFLRARIAPKLGICTSFCVAWAIRVYPIADIIDSYWDFSVIWVVWLTRTFKTSRLLIFVLIWSWSFYISFKISRKWGNIRSGVRISCARFIKSFAFWLMDSFLLYKCFKNIYKSSFIYYCNTSGIELSMNSKKSIAISRSLNTVSFWRILIEASIIAANLASEATIWVSYSGVKSMRYLRISSKAFSF